MNSLKQRLIQGSVILGLASLAWFNNTLPANKTQKIAPIAWADINGDGVKDAILGTVSNGYLKGMLNYVQEARINLQEKSLACFRPDPRDHIRPLLTLSYVDGKKITTTQGTSYTEATPLQLAEIDYEPGLEKRIQYKISENGTRLYIGRPGIITWVEIK